MWRWIWTVVAAAAVSFLLVGTDPTNTAERGDAAAARALEAVTSQTFDTAHPAASFPKNYQAVMGYLPITAVGPFGKAVLIKPDGDCSGPIGRTNYDFDIVCKQHDLSYDVLRYAADIGDPLPGSARKAADAMFGRQLHARCDSLDLAAGSSAWCHSIAESYGLICKVNGWRQGFGAPAHESSTRWIALEMLVFGFLVLRVHTELMLRHRRVRMLHDFTFIHGWHRHRGPPAPAALDPLEPTMVGR